MRLIQAALGAFFGLVAGLWLSLIAERAGMPYPVLLLCLLLPAGGYGGFRLGWSLTSWWSRLAAAAVALTMCGVLLAPLVHYLYLTGTWRQRFQDSRPKDTPDMTARNAAEAAAKAGAAAAVREILGKSDAVIEAGGADCDSNRLVRATVGAWQAWYWYSGRDSRITATLTQEELFKQTERYMPVGARLTVGQFISMVPFTYQTAGQERHGDLVFSTICGLSVGTVVLISPYFAVEVDTPLIPAAPDQGLSRAEKQAVGVARTAFGSSAGEASAIGMRGGGGMVRIADGLRTEWYWVRGDKIAARVSGEQLKAAVAAALPQPGPVSLRAQEGPPYQVKLDYGQGGPATALLGIKEGRFVLEYLVLDDRSPSTFITVGQPFPD